MVYLLIWWFLFLFGFVTSFRISSTIHFPHRYANYVKLARLSSMESKKSQDLLSDGQVIIAGASSRAFAQAVLHPLVVLKTYMQMEGHLTPLNQEICSPKVLFRGLGTQVLFSLPHGALYFLTLARIKQLLHRLLPLFVTDFIASSVATVISSVISTPQMVIADRVTVGLHSTCLNAIVNIYSTMGIAGFYVGWGPTLAQKIPSYGLTWMFYQQLQRLYLRLTNQSKPRRATINALLGVAASAAAVFVMNPLDTVKTRLVLQENVYKGSWDCFFRLLKEEGIFSFYRSLLPRLISVVPLMTLQLSFLEAVQGLFRESNRAMMESSATIKI